MSTLDVLKNEGRAEGLVSAILSLYADGQLSAQQTRSKLNQFVREGKVPRELKVKAFQELKNSKRGHGN